METARQKDAALVKALRKQLGKEQRRAERLENEPDDVERRSGGTPGHRRSVSVASSTGMKKAPSIDSLDTKSGTASIVVSWKCERGGKRSIISVYFFHSSPKPAHLGPKL